MIVARTAELAEEHLAAATMRCPRCAGRLIRWGYARPRTIRAHGADTVRVIPRRVRCTDCQRTDVVLPAALQARRADTTAVIAEALQHKADGVGYRRIAGLLGRPESTVRRWLARATTAHVQWMFHRGVGRLVQVAPEVFTELRLGANPLRDALSVLAAAAYWDRHRFGFTEPPYTCRHLHARQAARPVRLTATVPARSRARVSAGPCLHPLRHIRALVIGTLNADNDSHDADEAAATPITASPCRPTTRRWSSIKVTASWASKATGNSNGRSTREFFDLLLSERGAGIDWDKTDQTELYGACHTARADSDLNGLVAMFARTLDTDPAYDF